MENMAEVAWPDSLRKLAFEGYFLYPVRGVAWPASLQFLSFGLCRFALRNKDPDAEMTWTWPTRLRKS